MKSGFRLGNINFSINKSVRTTTDFFKKKRIALFSIYEDLNSLDNLNQLKKFESYYDRIKKLGIHEIYCCAIHNFETLKVKFDDIKITKTKIIPDEKGIFYKHLGVKNLDNNFMAIITDGIIEKWWQNKKNSNIAETKPFNNQAIPENCIIYLSGTE